MFFKSGVLLLLGMDVCVFGLTCKKRLVTCSLARQREMQDQMIPEAHVLETLQKASLVPRSFRDSINSELRRTKRCPLSAKSFFDRTENSVSFHHDTKNATWEITVSATPEQDVTSFVDFALATRTTLQIAEEGRKLTDVLRRH